MGIFSNDIPAYSAAQNEAAATGGGSPLDMGGVPSVMPSNDWWKSATAFGTQVLSTYDKILASRAQTGVAVPAGTISSSPMNPAPGSKGLFFQNASTAGARAPVQQGAGMSSQSMLIFAGVAVVLVLLMARR